MIKIIDKKDFNETSFYKECSPDVKSTVAEIIADVRQNGEKAVRRLSKKLDGIKDRSPKVREMDLFRAYMSVERDNPDLIESLLYARRNITDFAKAQKECYEDFEIEMEPGSTVTQRVVPVERVGVYIPAGRYPLVSSVLMNVIPAKVAEVGSIVLCTPPKKDDEFPADKNILAAAYLCGVDEVYAIGGAQAIAAMAYGAGKMQAVDVITGPGNAFVAEAKKQVYGKVGIDMTAGPTEVAIISDGSVDEKLIAVDMLAQSEHDTAARATLLTTNKDYALRVQSKIEELLSKNPESEVARKSIDDNGLIIVCDTIDDCTELANILAPEHLEIAIDSIATQHVLGNRCTNYGSLFLGAGACEVLGDYTAGINHTLPTLRGARYTGGLSVKTFLKILTSLEVSRAGVGQKLMARNAATIAQNEGLTFHKLAAELRSKGSKGQ